MNEAPLDTPRTDTEQAMRLADLQTGPWAARGLRAKKLLAPKTDLERLLEREGLLSLRDTETALGSADRRRIGRLSELLRDHWDSPVTEPEELALRESFDEALTLLQLLELAVQTGYLDLSSVRAAARSELVALLWSPPARHFVLSYDYLGVRLLAQRIDIDLGLPRVTPPDVDPAAELRFAAFLSHFEDWYDDRDLDAFLGLLDDYVMDDEYEGGDERAAFEAFLSEGALPTGANLATARRLASLAAGMDRFLRLADLFALFSGPERRYYGLFFSYWLAAFLGWQRGGKRQSYRYRESLDWSQCVLGPGLVPDRDTSTSGERKARRLQLIQARRVLRAAWAETRTLLEASIDTRR